MPDKDRETLIGLSRYNKSKLEVEMSKGTQFQLHLALRLAGHEKFAAAQPSVPFIAEDIMGQACVSIKPSDLPLRFPSTFRKVSG